jgi:hypothetical protein
MLSNLARNDRPTGALVAAARPETNVRLACRGSRSAEGPWPRDGMNPVPHRDTSVCPPAAVWVRR